MAQTYTRSTLPVAWGFIVWWVALLLLHIASMLYYVAFASFYKAMSKWTLTYQLQTFSIGIAPSEYKGLAWTDAALSAIHAFYTLKMVGSSLFARRLVFNTTLPTNGIWAFLRTCFQRALHHQQVQVVPQNQPSQGAGISKHFTDAASRTTSSILGRSGLFGVDNVYFGDLLVLRELFETSLQTYQAWDMTRLLPQLGFIRFYVALLVANFWSVPLLHRVYRDQHYKRRLMSLLCDAVLDTFSSMGTTVLIFR